ncbi:hypothetical protein QNH14_07290 [Apirhabdus apintestini]|uniref:hypothetical protein n=1 Tax=Erwinia sp. HR93 TaxID=3094840 RepID=UPI002ADEF042|nr:hypothetical protein [Erwinia sp. HR93]MEA1065299.1 hypothetical protein [Erwinia sp. HR93]WPM85661.1 hypothetical protein QNH14_07290 [Enterobacteriaceae bacterium CA-0114]
MDAALLLVVIVIIIPVIGLIVLYVPSVDSRMEENWMALPERGQYLMIYPDALSDSHPICHQCFSSRTLNVGYRHAKDKRRMVICQACKRQLWRESAL